MDSRTRNKELKGTIKFFNPIEQTKRSFKDKTISSSDNNTEEFKKKLNEYLIEQVESEKIETITSNINLDLVKNNGEL